MVDVDPRDDARRRDAAVREYLPGVTRAALGGVDECALTRFPRA
jgi:hypothetical protein